MLRHLSVISELVKYRLSLAVALSSVTGYFLYSNLIELTLLHVAAGVFLLASGAAALNQYTERNSDALMERTGSRPLPSRRITKRTTVVISLLLIISGSLILLQNGPVPFLLGILNMLIYNLLYTGLKKKTILAIIPGAMVGAIPPMIGFASAGGPLSHPYILVFSVFMFLWQLPHFWLLLIKYGKEYNAAGFETISGWMTQKEIRLLVFLWVLLSTTFFLVFFAVAETLNSRIFLPLTLVNIMFIVLFHRLLFRREAQEEIRGPFMVINLYSLLVMLFIIGASLYGVL